MIDASRFGRGQVRTALAVIGMLVAASCGGAPDNEAVLDPTDATVGAVTIPVQTTVTTTTIAGQGTLPEDELIQLQLDCVYGSVAESCDRLVIAGYPSATNYGLGNSLTQSPDAALVEQCNGGWRLHCAELLVRYPATNGVPPSATSVPLSFTDDELTDLRLGCIYGGAAFSCENLVAAGFSADDNYGLGNSYSQAPDGASAANCSVQDRLACAEMVRRYPPSAGDDVVVRDFVSALVAATPLDGLVPQYLAIQMTGTPTQVVSVDQAALIYDPASGMFNFTLVPGTLWQCHAGGGLVRTCTYSAG